MMSAILIVLALATLGVGIVLWATRPASPAVRAAEPIATPGADSESRP